jgi:hypothetical protein
MYFLSFLIVGVFTVKLIEVRSACTRQKAAISVLVKKIKLYRSKNRELMIEFFEIVEPKNVDERTKYMKLLRENEVVYLK